MKGWLRKYLRKKGWYDDIRYSSIFQLYQRFFKRSGIKKHQLEVSFYRSFLPPCHLIFDIGAYDGHKTAAFLEISEKVVCCEPDSLNHQTLLKRFRKLRSRVFIEKKAVGDYEGKGILMIHHPGSAFNTLNEKWKKLLETDKVEKWNEKITFSEQQVETELITLDILIQKYGTPDFIKIDTEGYEKKVLKGLSQSVNYISFECMYPDFKPELVECLDHLETISGTKRYNVAVDEKLLLKDFSLRADLLHWIEFSKVTHFEVIVNMQNVRR